MPMDQLKNLSQPDKEAKTIPVSGNKCASYSELLTDINPLTQSRDAYISKGTKVSVNQQSAISSQSFENPKGVPEVKQTLPSKVIKDSESFNEDIQKEAKQRPSENAKLSEKSSDKNRETTLIINKQKVSIKIGDNILNPIQKCYLGRPRKSDISSRLKIGLDTSLANQTDSSTPKCDERNVCVSPETDGDLVRRRNRAKKILENDEKDEFRTTKDTLKKRKIGRPKNENKQLNSDSGSDNEDFAQVTKKRKYYILRDGDSDDEVSTPKRQEIVSTSDNKVLELTTNHLDGRELVGNGSNDPTDEKVSEPLKTTKKRGRPRKTATETPEVETEAPVIMSTSKRGRKRRDINYSLLFDEQETTSKKTGSTNTEVIKRNQEYMSDDESDLKDNALEEKNEPSETSSSDNKQVLELTTNDLDGRKLVENDSNGSTDEKVSEPLKTTIKRGRPSKSAATETPEIKTEAPLIMSTSKKGRKRRDINYSLLFDEQESTRIKTESTNTQDIKKKEEYMSDNESGLKDNYLVKKNEPSETSSSDNKQVLELTTNHLDGRKLVDNGSTDEKVSETATETPEIKTEAPLMMSTLKNEPNNLLNQNAKHVGSSKYKWTGHKTTALNQIFSALQRKDVSEVSHDPQSGFDKRTKAKISDDSLLDEDGTSVCMVCKETVVNGDWLEHKRKVHYNLAYRQGEPSINTSDVTFIQKVFAQLRKEQGYLKCRKCKKKIGQSQKFIEHLDICNGVVNANGSVTCAVCKKEMGKSEWQYHKYKDHNNLAWREGDPPLNLQDRDLVVRILTQLYKAKKPLHCETCKLQKKSVMGYLSHRSVCQMSGEALESVKVACKLCGRKTLPVSMEFHMKTHNKPSKYIMLQDSGYFDVDVDTGTPRKAAKQALRVIKSIKGEFGNSSKYYVGQCDFDEDFVVNELKKKVAECPDLSCLFRDCEFKTACIEAMIEHLKSCDSKPEQYYVCKLCLAWCPEETEIKEHIKSIHNRSDDKDDEFGSEPEQADSYYDQLIEDAELEKKRLRQKGKIMIMNNGNQRAVKPIFLVHPLRERNDTLVYSQAYPWMVSFCLKHYNNFCLFQDLRNSEPWQVLDCDILNDYLPRHHESCDMTVKTVAANDNLDDVGKLDFRKLGLFEVCSFYKGEATIFCGGPVSALAWLPTPYKQNNHSQILAVAVLNESEKDYVVDETYNEPYVVQFWSFGELNRHQACDFKPFLLFGLALITGPVWHMEWCPSGCLDVSKDSSNSRLGLLAVATSDSFVYIYCIDDVKEESDRGLIYEGKPLVKLQLETESKSNGQSYYATRISWTKAEGHRYIAVGYSTGVIALFDLLSTAALLHRRDTTQIILPYQTLQGHASCITGLTLGHMGGGNRWCFSSGLDKGLIFWDLSNLTKITSHRKYGVAEGLWLTQWPTCLVAEEETTFNETSFAHSFIKPIRDVMCPEYCSFTFSQSGIKSIAFSDWLNLILHGGNAGEVTAQFAHRMFFNIDKKYFKKSYARCIFSVAKKISKNPSNNQAATYEEATTHYGIAFMDYNADELNNIPNSKTNDVKCVQVEKYVASDYPLQAINKVAVNPNEQACSFYASGHQAGFVRVRGMDFLKNHFNPQTYEGYNFCGSL